MALTGRVLFYGYRKNQYDLKNQFGTPATNGIQFSLPSSLCVFKPAPASTVANGVTMATIIELLPSGLYHNGQSDAYYTADTITTLNENGS